MQSQMKQRSSSDPGSTPAGPLIGSTPARVVGTAATAASPPSGVGSAAGSDTTSGDRVRLVAFLCTIVERLRQGCDVISFSPPGALATFYRYWKDFLTGGAQKRRINSRIQWRLQILMLVVVKRHSGPEKGVVTEGVFSLEKILDSQNL